MILGKSAEGYVLVDFWKEEAFGRLWTMMWVEDLHVGWICGQGGVKVGQGVSLPDYGGHEEEEQGTPSVDFSRKLVRGSGTSATPQVNTLTLE
jgi:hypothetical protein